MCLQVLQTANLPHHHPPPPIPAPHIRTHSHALCSFSYSWSKLTDMSANAFTLQILSGGCKLSEGNFLKCQSIEYSEQHRHTRAYVWTLQAMLSALAKQQISTAYISLCQTEIFYLFNAQSGSVEVSHEHLNACCLYNTNKVNQRIQEKLEQEQGHRARKVLFGI